MCDYALMRSHLTKRVDAVIRGGEVGLRHLGTRSSGGEKRRVRAVFYAYKRNLCVRGLQHFRLGDWRGYSRSNADAIQRR